MKLRKFITGIICGALMVPYMAFAGVALDEEYLNGAAFEEQTAQTMYIAVLSDSEMESTEGAGWWWVVPVVFSLLLSGDTPQDRDSSGNDNNASAGGVSAAPSSGWSWWDSWSWSRR